MSQRIDIQVIKATVVNLTKTKYYTLNEKGEKVFGNRTINVRLDGGESGFINEGHPDFLTWKDKVCIGCKVTVETDPKTCVTKPGTSSSGNEVTYYNMSTIWLKEILQPEVNEEFKDLPDVLSKDDEFTESERKKKDEDGNSTPSKTIDKKALEASLKEALRTEVPI